VEVGLANDIEHVIYIFRIGVGWECSQFYGRVAHPEAREKISWTDRVKNEVLHSQGGQEYPAYNKKNKGQQDWSYFG
jgi:hypothetical protein